MEGKYSGKYKFSEAAKGFGIKQKELIKVLHDNAYIYKRPNAPWMPCVGKREYFTVTKITDGRGECVVTLLNKTGIELCEQLLEKEFRKEKIK